MSPQPKSFKRCVITTADPTTDDVSYTGESGGFPITIYYEVPTFWLNETSNNLFIMTANNGETANWEQPVMKCLKPAFMARVGSAIPNFTGDNVVQTVIFGSEVFDTLNNYDHTTGIFTAPRDGIYKFDVTISASNFNASHTNGRIGISVNGFTRPFQGMAQNPFACQVGGGVCSYVASALIDLTSADAVHASFTVGTDTKTVQIDAASSTYFSGHLVS
jgi:hypothetical protein